MYEKQIKVMTVLTKLYRTLNDSLGQDLKSRGITATDYTILVVLRDFGEMSMQELGTKVFITSGTITYATNRLIERGMVKKLQDTEDRRKFYVRLSKEGEERLKIVDDEHVPYLAALLADFSEGDLDEITENIKRLGKAVQSKI